ncbi:MAG TPA: hypothetical protein VMV27_07815 [Candidatus Binataceae bacterium]|nr:hypothetical protein [Candidatus Binataceae bacterium]
MRTLKPAVASRAGGLHLERAPCVRFSVHFRDARIRTIVGDLDEPEAEWASASGFEDHLGVCASERTEHLAQLRIGRCPRKISYKLSHSRLPLVYFFSGLSHAASERRMVTVVRGQASTSHRKSVGA